MSTASIAACPRILGAVNEADEVAVVEVAEGLYLVHWRHSVSKARHQLRCQFEAQIHAFRANVEEQIARRRDGVMFFTANLPEGMQQGGPRLSK